MTNSHSSKMALLIVVLRMIMMVIPSVECVQMILAVKWNKKGGCVLDSTWLISKQETKFQLSLPNSSRLQARKPKASDGTNH